MRWPRSQWTLHGEGCVGTSAGGRGNCGRWGLPCRVGRGGRGSARSDRRWGAPRSAPSARPRRPGWGGRGSSAPISGPSRGDPPSLRGAQPSLPPPGAARPRSPHLETLLHPQLLHGGGGGRAGGRARRGPAGAGRSRRRGRGRSGERAGAGGSRRRWRKEPGAPGAQAGRRLQRRRPEPAPPPPAGTLPSAPSLSCSPASPGAAVTGLPAPPPRICLPGSGHMGKLRHRKGCSGPMKNRASLSLGAQCECRAAPPASRGADLEGQSNRLAHSANMRTGTLYQTTPNSLWPEHSAGLRAGWRRLSPMQGKGPHEWKLHVDTVPDYEHPPGLSGKPERALEFFDGGYSVPAPWHTRAHTHSHKLRCPEVLPSFTNRTHLLTHR